MTGRRSPAARLIPGALVIPALASALLPSAASAQVVVPALQSASPCYGEFEPVELSGSDFTPLGAVQYLFSAAADLRGSYDTQADARGAIASTIDVKGLLRDEDRAEVTVTANDQARIDANQQPPESQYAATTFTYTRTMGFSPAQWVPGRKARVEVFGWTAAGRRPIRVVFRRREFGRTIASVTAGTVTGDCGDLVARVRTPRSLKPGHYTVLLALTKTPRSADFFTYRRVRVVAPRPRTERALGRQLATKSQGRQLATKSQVRLAGAERRDRRPMSRQEP